MTRRLHIAPDLSLPLTFVTGTQAILATKGMGKSFLAQVEAEELLELQQQIVVIDPTDAWNGLRSSADGKSPGYPIAVFGGDHGNAELEPDSGVPLAEAIIAEGFSAVICTEGLSAGGEVRLVRELLETLYRKNRKPLHIFVDEADLFAPQKPFDPEDAKSIRAMSNIVRRGRRKGLGCTMITQRSAVLNKDVLAMVDMLMVLGMSHNLDIEPIERWMKRRKKDGAAAVIEEMLSSLSELQNGDAWAWSPTTKLHKRFRARAKRTFDSGATPKVGQKMRVAKVLAPIDIQRLGAQIAAAVQRQKENDPKALKAEVVALRRELDRQGKGQDRAEENEKLNHAENIELRTRLAAIQKKRSDVKDDRLARIEKLFARHEKLVEGFMKPATAVITACCAARDTIAATNEILKELRSTNEEVSLRKYSENSAKEFARVKAEHRVVRGPQLPLPVIERSGETQSIGKAELRILEALSWMASLGHVNAATEAVAFLAGYTVNGHFTNMRGRLRSAGLIEYPTVGTICLTTAGRGQAPVSQRPTTNAALHEAIRARLNTAQWKILAPLIEAWPATIGNEDLALATGYTVNGHFTNMRGRLRTMGMIEYPRAGECRATDLLFPESR